MLRFGLNIAELSTAYQCISKKSGVLVTNVSSEFTNQHYIQAKVRYAIGDHRYAYGVTVRNQLHTLHSYRHMQAQFISSVQIGEYYLDGVMEVGSGFRFNSNHSFDFFFSYGGIDRVAKGIWAQQGENLILNTAGKPQKDFVFTDSKRTDRDQLVIKISDPDPLILGYVSCQIRTPHGIVVGESDDEGRIILENRSVQAISLIHRLWPDRPSIFEIPATAHNYFEFSIGTWIADVEFRDLMLLIEDKLIIGPHPLLEGNRFRYVGGE